MAAMVPNYGGAGAERNRAGPFTSIISRAQLIARPRALAEAPVQTRNAAKFSAAVARGLRESAAIAIAVVAVVLFVALASYSPEDSGFSFAGTSNEVHNRI